MKKIVFFIALFIAPFVVSTAAVHAAERGPVGIQVRPLMYKETLKPDTTEKGFIDVSNATKENVTLVTSIQLFTQTDDQGSLRFYDADYAKQAIVPDLKEFDLGPREAIRLYFTVNSSKLPDGDVLAAVFVTNKTASKPLAITPAVRVGTLLIFENGKPGPRNSSFTDFQLPFFQIGDAIKGSLSVKNMADEKTQSAFFAEVKFSVEPWGETTTKQSPLITSGRTRSMDFSIPSNQIGFYKVDVSTSTASAYKWVFVVTGAWRTGSILVLFGVIFVLIALGFVVKRRRSKRISLH